MKKYIKKMWGQYVIAFAISFMLFFYEPIIFYSNNINDLWFDLRIILHVSNLLFICSFIFILLLLNITYFINRKFNKIVYFSFFLFFIYLYIQGNFLVGSLPILDGTPINWNVYKLQNIISTILLIAMVIAFIIVISKKYEVHKFTGFITIAILIMLSSSLVSTIFSKNILNEKEITIAPTYKDINTYSTEKNFIIFLLDATDAKYFSDALKENSEFNHLLDDFTFYPDTISAHPFTAESIPYILTGKKFYNQEEFASWQTNALKESNLLNYLYEKKYMVNLYDNGIIFNDRKALNVNNMVEVNGINFVDIQKFVKEEIRYILFRYLPFPLKKYSKIENMNFGLEKVSKSDNLDIDYYNEDNFNFLDRLDTINLEKKKNFKYIHLDGAHIPFTFNKDLDEVLDADYYSEVEGMGTITKKYFDYLKEHDVYDNSVIILMADHGYNVDASVYGRQNPILYIKGLYEKHEEMNISDKPISFEVLNVAYKDLLDDKKSIELFHDIDMNRKRIHFIYANDTKVMKEYETTGKAWETDKLKPTGNVFNPVK